MQVYEDTELHSFRAGRTFDIDFFTDNFELGLKKLGGGGKLKSWISKTTRSRGLQILRDLSPQPFVDADDNDDSSGEEEDPDHIVKNSGNTFGVVHVSDGDLVFFPVDMEAEAAKIIQDIESTSGNETEDSESDVDAMDVDENSGTET